jgi:excisionase family DNA binding protein
MARAAHVVDLATLPAALTIEEAADVLRISRGAAYEAARRGELPSVRLGRSLRVPRSRLLELLGESVPTPDEPPIGAA